MPVIHGRPTAVSPAPPSRPRLRLQPGLTGRTLLDGGWWPRPSDPAAELPGLILAIDQRPGPAARAAMDQTAQTGNRTHTSALLAAITTPGHPGNTQLGTWEWEGGHLA